MNGFATYYYPNDFRSVFWLLIIVSAEEVTLMTSYALCGPIGEMHTVISEPYTQQKGHAISPSPRRTDQLTVPEDNTTDGLLMT